MSQKNEIEDVSECCGNCKYGKTAMTPDKKINFMIKVCKRFPPVGAIVPDVNTGNVSFQYMWPNMGIKDWCGEYSFQTYDPPKLEKN